jgi:hypothetical protein
VCHMSVCFTRECNCMPWECRCMLHVRMFYKGVQLCAICPFFYKGVQLYATCLHVLQGSVAVCHMSVCFKRECRCTPYVLMCYKGVQLCAICPYVLQGSATVCKGSADVCHMSVCFKKHLVVMKCRPASCHYLLAIHTRTDAGRCIMRVLYVCVCFGGGRDE